jgi:hypothetical protein
LTGQGFPALADAHHVQRVGSVARGLHDRGIGSHTKEVSDFPTNPFCGLKVIKLDLDGNGAGNNVQPTSETKNGGEFRYPLRCLIASSGDEFVFDSDSQ